MNTYWNFLKNNKLFTVVSVVGFAVSLMFVLLLGTYVKQELSVDRFHANKDRIYLMCRDDHTAAFANLTADVVKDDCPEVESYCRLVSRPIPLSQNRHSDKFTVEALFADSAFFNIFSFRLLEGNAANVLATKHTAVVTQTFARKLFHHENPVGKFLYYNDTIPVEITGMMEDFPLNTQIPQSEVVFNYRMIEYNWGDDILTTWNNSSFGMYFLAKEGADLPAKAPVLLEKFKEDYWIYKNGFAKELYFMPFLDVYFGGVKNYFSNIQTNSKTLVSVYLIITILILVVAILNYINLSVAQAGKRGKEAAIKKLLGSGRKQLIMQFISESMLMTVISFCLGLLLAFLAEPFFNNVLDTQLNLGGQFSGILFVVSVVFILIIIGVLAGIIPAYTISRFKPVEVIKGTYTRNVKAVYSKILITFQYLVAFVLLACSLFIVKQTYFMRNYNLGFERENILILQNKVNANRTSALRSELETIAGVDKVSFTQGTPLDGGNNNSFEYNGQALSFQVFEVDTVFMDLFGIKYQPTGVTPGKNTFMVNRKGYHALQPDSISHTVKIYGIERQISGITDDFHFRSLHNEVGLLMIRRLPDEYWPWSVVVKIKANADPYQTANEIKRVYSDFTGGEPFESTFADEKVQEWYIGEERTMKILTAFTILTFMILLMGILAMSLYYVRQKEKEIGIRKVNGAKISEILTMLNLNFLKWITLAFVISVPVTRFAMQKWLAGFAYRTTLSWWVFALTVLVVLVLSVISISLQSWKAANTNPVESLKSE